MASAALLEAIRGLAAALPAGVTAALGQVLRAAPADGWPELTARALAVLPAPAYREQVGRFLEIWRANAPAEPPASVALALDAAAHALQVERQSQTIELVWTGPAGSLPLRRTSQVLYRLIEEAQTDLLIVSFAVYDIPEIAAALAQAARRGVRLTLVVESPQASAGRVAFDTLAAFGAEVRAAAQVYQWPLASRPTDAQGRHGSLHAKCAVADATILLISSANLTAYALSLNMELGVLVRGGPQPAEVHAHMTNLIQRGVLARVS